MAILLNQNPASGGPGIPPRWTRSDKDGVGTAYSARTAAWEFVTPILEAWQRQPSPRFPNYAAGSWGPVEADRLLSGCQQGWRQSQGHPQ